MNRPHSPETGAEAGASRRPTPWLARASLTLPAILVVYLLALIGGGGSTGFGAWNDVGRMLMFMAATAVLGLGLSVASVWRGEKSWANPLAIMIHTLFLFLLVLAFNQ